MMAAYGAIAREICRCMKERAYFDAANGGAAKEHGIVIDVELTG